MNATRRSAIGAQVQFLSDAKENLRDEEQGYYDNMPESLQNDIDGAITQLEGIE